MLIDLMKPVVVEEIEFYISDSGEHTGMSLSGLARLCGVTLSTIQRLTTKINEDATLRKIELSALEGLFGKVFSNNQATDNNSKIVDSEACAAIIEYYAFDSKAKNEKALFSYRKFAKKGINTWIKEITNHDSIRFDKPAYEILKDMYSELLELKEETRELRVLKGKTKTVYLGLDNLIKEEDLLPPENTEDLSRNYTITEWLREYKGIIGFDPSYRSKLAIMASQNYKALRNRDPEKGIRRHNNGKINNGVTVYYLEDLPILDLAFSTLFLKKVN